MFYRNNMWVKNIKQTLRCSYGTLCAMPRYPTNNTTGLTPGYASVKAALCTNSTRVRRNDADFSTFAGTKNKIILKRITE